MVRASAAHTAGMGPAEVVEAYKDLKFNEAGFRSLKTIDLDVRPIHHWTEDRVRATCSSACSPCTSFGTCAGPGRRSVSPTKRH